jgi:drug/metabolite transporter (DMT)-like permease
MLFPFKLATWYLCFGFCDLVILLLHVNNFRAHCILSFTALIAGFNYSISKIIMPEFVLPAAIVVIRGISASIFFWIIYLSFSREKIDYKNDLPRIFLCALTGIACNQLLFFEGLNLTTPINASLLQCGVPVFVLVISAIMIREKITGMKILGVFLGALGAVLLLVSSALGSAGVHYVGDLLIIINALSYAFFLVLIKPLMAKYKGLTIAAWVFGLGTMMTFPFGYQDILRIQWQSMPAYALWSLAFIVVFSTIIAYYLNITVMKFVNPSVAGIYIYVQLVFTTLIAVWFGKDHLTFEKALYSLIIFTGVYLVSVRK